MGKRGENLRGYEPKDENRHPVFRKRWKFTPTKAIRVPTIFAEILLAIARRLDDETLSQEDLGNTINRK